MWSNKITDAFKCKIQVTEDVVGNVGHFQITEAQHAGLVGRIFVLETMFSTGEV